jgi:hypothetical protein
MITGGGHLLSVSPLLAQEISNFKGLFTLGEFPMAVLFFLFLFSCSFALVKVKLSHIDQTSLKK